MGEMVVRRAASVARALAFAAVLSVQAGLATAQTSNNEWHTDDGGAVVVKPDGSFEMAMTDSETGESIFSEGRVVDRRPSEGGGFAMTLKPRLVSGGKQQLFVIEVSADGSGDLFVVTGQNRHKATHLRK